MTFFSEEAGMTFFKFIVLAVPACAWLLAGCCGRARAEGASAETAAHAVARGLRPRPRRMQEVLQRPGGEDGLEEWTRSVIDGALDRAGHAARNVDRNASPVPLTAESNAAPLGRSFAARGNTPEVLVFMSLSAPAESWRQWAGEAASIGAPILLRGVMKEGLRATAGRIGGLLDGAGAGAAIDPRLFRLFRIGLVPAVAAVPGGVPPCSSRGCADDPPPPFDLITGNAAFECSQIVLASSLRLRAGNRDTVS